MATYPRDSIVRVAIVVDVGDGLPEISIKDMREGEDTYESLLDLANWMVWEAMAGLYGEDDDDGGDGGGDDGEPEFGDALSPKTDTDVCAKIATT